MNYKHAKLIILSLFLSMPLFAQDTILTLHRKKIISTVLEINVRDVKYKKYAEPNGRSYVIDKREVIKISYFNGSVDTLNVKLAKIPEKAKPVPPIKKPDLRATDYFSNFTFITVSDLFLGVLSFGYERTFKSGKYSLLIPVSFGMSALGITPPTYDNSSPLAPVVPTGMYYCPNKIFSTGLELNHFPWGQGTIKYYMAPALEYGQFQYYLYEGVPSDPGTFDLVKHTSSFFTFMFKNGALFQPSKTINISAYAGMGFANFGMKLNSTTSGEYYYSDRTFENFTFEFGINAGYKF